MAEGDLSFRSVSGLRRTNHRNAILMGVDLSFVKLNETIFSNTMLYQIKGLSHLVHIGPSTVDDRTLIRSIPDLSTDFLKGCGWTDWKIEAAKLYNPNLTSGLQVTS